MGTTFFGAVLSRLKILEGKLCPKFGGISDNLIANISGTDTAVDKLITGLLTTVPLVLDENNGELSPTSYRVYAANVNPPNINSARDFGQLYTLIANVSGTDQAIDKRKTDLSTTIHSTFNVK